MLSLINFKSYKRSHFICLRIKKYWKKNRLKNKIVQPIPLNSVRSFTCKSQITYKESKQPYLNYLPKNIVFFGTDKFSLISLQSLLQGKKEGVISQLHIVTSPQKSPYPAVPKFCKKFAIPYEEWLVSSPLQGFDLGIVVSFGYLIPQSIIESFPLGIINVHGSLLPRWRGSSPIIHAILNRDEETGITIMKIHPYKFDVGEIIYQEKIAIHNEKLLELTNKMAVLGAKCLMHCLTNFPEIMSQARPQPSEGVTTAPKIKEEDSRIIWEKMTPDLIHSMFLAFDDYHPLWCIWHGKKVKLKELVNWHHELPSTFRTDQHTHRTIFRFIKKLKANRSESKMEEELERNASSFTVSGQILYRKKDKVLRIRCLHGYVDFKAIALQGKATMTACDFHNGYLSKVKFTQLYFL